MDRRTIISQVSFARRLPDPVLAALEGASSERMIERGALITLEGEPAEAMYVVAAGRVKVVRHSLEGREQILHIVEPLDHFNTVPIFGGGACPATTEALLPTRLLAFPRDQMRRLAQDHSELAMALLGEFANRLRGMVGLVENLALHTVNGRLARLLLQQAAAAEQGQPQPMLTQAEMAAHIGSVREMVGRALKAFEAAGLISLDRGVIQILDRERLAAQADQ
ncbi:MAG TPA: Crp/Fnr family transcriptional regulator [Herpetosiphonaceae bacterium]|nr:Crp/Fnr family transcriptional regulator [Herpetosiphonaceae bacterium]